jgi:hypothetical protein
MAPLADTRSKNAEVQMRAGLSASGMPRLMPSSASGRTPAAVTGCDLGMESLCRWPAEPAGACSPPPLAAPAMLRLRLQAHAWPSRPLPLSRLRLAFNDALPATAAPQPPLLMWPLLLDMLLPLPLKPVACCSGCRHSASREGPPGPAAPATSAAASLAHRPGPGHCSGPTSGVASSCS